MKGKKRRAKKQNRAYKELWNNIKWSMICIIGILKGRERDQDKGITFWRDKAEHFPKVMNDNKLKILEARGLQAEVRKKI